MDRVTLIRPDDWHLHLRDGAHLAAVLADSARRFARAVVMPNLPDPVRTTEQALAYRGRIVAALPAGAAFEPLMTLYLTDDTPPEEIVRARASGQVRAVKLYPAGATTHSAAGVTRISRCFHTLERMQELGMPLLVHGEVTDPEVDVFDREAVFIEEVLGPLIERFPGLKVVLEHITTREAAQFVEVTGPNVAATCSRAACDRIITACPCSSARRTARRWSKPRPREIPNSSSAPTARRTRATRRRRRAAAPASTRRTPRSSSTPWRSRKRTPSTGSRASPAASGRSSTGSRSTRIR
jgi:hypothetical protein